ncbi:hypothetical protein TURU_156836 [Turdus rufiventris]|nr:hypothetical protein TURU_156836 [Turdus rufiventris]
MKRTLVDEKLNVSHQCDELNVGSYSPETQPYPGLHQEQCGQQVRRGGSPTHSGEKPGTEQDEIKLQIASKQIVQTAILRAVQQVSQETQQKEKRTNTGTSLQLERGKLTKKHEKK